MDAHLLLPLFDELRGPRVALRPYRPDDAQATYDAIMESLAEIRPWLPFAKFYDKPDGLDEMRAYINRTNANRLLREEFASALWRTDDNTFLGAIGLHPRNWAIRSFEIGYWQRTSATGHGYMTEAVKLLADYAFATYDAQRILIRCDAANARSAAIPLRLGFVEEGQLRNVEPSHQGGGLRTMRYFSLIPTDPRWPE
jgi:ribosomal-protein-serine acetyltransferase